MPILAHVVTDLQDHGFDYWSKHILLHLHWLKGHPDLKETNGSSYQ